MLFDSSLYSFGDLPNDSFHQVKTTGFAGGLIRPCKGLSPASANRALKIWQSRLYYRQPPSSGSPRLSTKRVLSESESTLFVDSLFHQHSWWFSFSNNPAFRFLRANGMQGYWFKKPQLGSSLQRILFSRANHST